MIRFRTAALFTLAAAFSVPALAGTLDLTVKILDENRSPVVDQFSPGKITEGKQCGEPGEKTCLTVASAVTHALLMCGGPPFCSKEDATGDEKYRRAKLVDKIEADPKNATLSIEMAPTVKRLVGVMYTPLIVKQVWDVLEPPSAQEKPQ